MLSRLENDVVRLALSLGEGDRRPGEARGRPECDVDAAGPGSGKLCAGGTLTCASESDSATPTMTPTSQAVPLKQPQVRPGPTVTVTGDESLGVSLGITDVDLDVVPESTR